MFEEIPVEGNPVFCFPGFQPFRLFTGKALPFLKKQDIAGGFRPGVFQERGIRQPHSAQKHGSFRNVPAHTGIPFVHGSLAGDKSNQAARPHFVQGFCKEIVVDQELVLVIFPVGQLILPKRDVANCQIKEIIGEIDFFKTIDRNLCIGIKLFGDPPRDVVQLYAVQFGFIHAVRNQAKKVADTTGRLEDIPCVKAKAR